MAKVLNQEYYRVVSESCHLPMHHSYCAVCMALQCDNTLKQLFPIRI